MDYRFRLYFASLAVAAIAGLAFSQTPDEHVSHHPSPGAASSGSASPKSPADTTADTTMGTPGNPPEAAMGGMGGGMGEMMKQMGKPPRKELYPSLMALPDDVTAEERAGIEQLARERMEAGTALLSSGLAKLTNSTSNEDYSAMQEAAGQMREGLAEFEAGIAARRVFAEGKAPRNLALDWFKREMNLALPIQPEEPRTFLGVTPFHLFTMAMLVVFALAMIAMYFFKMRRAAALFGRIETDADPAPPVTPPPGGGTPKPRAPAPPGDDSNPPDKTRAPPATEVSAAPPVTSNWRGHLRVGNIVTETPSVKTFRLLPPSNDRFLPFTFVPGQFLNVAFSIGGARMNRSYSISSPTERAYVDLTVRREPRGAVSRHIDDLLKVGDQIETGGPVGKFTFDGTEADSIVLISGGVGITPMMSITRYLTERSWAGEIYFLYICRKPADFLFADELAKLERLNSKLTVAVTISKAEGTDWKGHRGRITKDWLTRTVPDLALRRTHLCGPPAMMDAVKAIFTELGIPSDQLKTEAFGAIKPAPAAAGITASPTSPATGPLVTFSNNNKQAKIRIDLQTGDSPPRQSILELSEELGIGIEFSCRVGTCGICKVKMTSGEVDMAVQDALDAGDKTKGVILACQAKPKGEVAVEA